MADKERLDIISGAIASLLKRQQEVDARLERIEGALQLSPWTAPAAESTPPPSAITAEIPTPIPAEEPSPISRQPELETEMGLRWVNRIGALTLVLAVAFAFKLAVDNQWIGPADRVMLGMLAGFATLGVADLLWRRGHRVYAQGVSGLGVAILYLSFYASFGFYQIVPHPLAFLLMVSCTTLACALALRYDSSAIAEMGLLGGFATPVLLATAIDRPWVLFSFVFLLDAAAIALFRFKRWWRVAVLALGATIFLYQGWWLAHFTPQKRTVAAVFDFAYYVLFVTVPSVWFLVVPQAIATIALAAIFVRELVPFSALLLAISGAGAALSDRRNGAAGLQVTVASSWLTYSLFYSALRSPVATGPLLALTTSLFLLFFLWIPWRVFYRNAEVRAVDLAAATVNASAYFAAGYLLLAASHRSFLGLFTISLAAIHLALGIHLWRGRADRERPRNAALVYLALALTLVTLAIPIQFSGFRITMGWMLEAAALTWIGRRAAAQRFILAALVVFALGFLRLFIIDAWIYPDPLTYTLIANNRFLTFIVAAACLGSAAWWLKPSRQGGVLYLAAHFTALWIVSQEVVSWAHRASTPETLWNTQSAGLSILWALYAVALTAAGVVGKLALNRVLGLALLGVVVLKLYLNDIWQLRLAYRVTAFTVLGVLLLLTSFLYSKYRGSIGDWWRDERPET